MNDDHIVERKEKILWHIVAVLSKMGLDFQEKDE